MIIVNLDRDVGRFTRLMRGMEGQAISIRRLSAVLGNSLPRTVIGRIPGTDTTPSGTLGCFLSHLRVWEMVVDAKPPGALVVEDDVEVVGDLREGALQAAGSGADFVFFNNRMSMDGRGEGDALLPVTDIIRARATRSNDACGTDGYYVSRAGAAKLIALVAEHGLWGDVDWFMLYAALGDTGVAGVADNASFALMLRRSAEFYRFSEPRLAALAMRRPLVRHIEGQSVRLILNQKNVPRALASTT